MHLSTIPITLTLTLASLLPFAVSNPTGLTDLTEAAAPAAPQFCCNCESCDACDASCPDPGCGLFECCCSTGRVLEARDGTKRFFNLAGREMNFVSKSKGGLE